MKRRLSDARDEVCYKARRMQLATNPDARLGLIRFIGMSTLSDIPLSSDKALPIPMKKGIMSFKPNPNDKRRKNETESPPSIFEDTFDTSDKRATLDSITQMLEHRYLHALETNTNITALFWNQDVIVKNHIRFYANMKLGNPLCLSSSPSEVWFICNVFMLTYDFIFDILRNEPSKPIKMRDGKHSDEHYLLTNDKVFMSALRLMLISRCVAYYLTGNQSNRSTGSSVLDLCFGKQLSKMTSFLSAIHDSGIRSCDFHVEERFNAFDVLIDEQEQEVDCQDQHLSKEEDEPITKQDITTVDMKSNSLEISTGTTIRNLHSTLSKLPSKATPKDLQPVIHILDSLVSLRGQELRPLVRLLTSSEDMILSDALLSSLYESYINEHTSAVKVVLFVEAFLLPALSNKGQKSNGSTRLSRVMISLITNLCTCRPIECIDSLFIDLLLNQSDLNHKHHCELIGRIIKTSSLPTESILHLLRQLVLDDMQRNEENVKDANETKRSILWSESVMPIVTSCIQMKPNVSEDVLLSINEKINRYSLQTEMTSNSKFSILVQSFVVRYSEQISSNTLLVESLLQSSSRLKTFVGKSIKSKLTVMKKAFL